MSVSLRFSPCVTKWFGKRFKGFCGDGETAAGDGDRQRVLLSLGGMASRSSSGLGELGLPVGFVFARGSLPKPTRFNGISLSSGCSRKPRESLWDGRISRPRP